MQISHDLVQSVTAVLGILLAIVVPIIQHKISSNKKEISLINTGVIHQETSNIILLENSNKKLQKRLVLIRKVYFIFFVSGLVVLMILNGFYYFNHFIKNQLPANTNLFDSLSNLLIVLYRLLVYSVIHSIDVFVFLNYIFAVLILLLGIIFKKNRIVYILSSLVFLYLNYLSASIIETTSLDVLNSTNNMTIEKFGNIVNFFITFIAIAFVWTTLIDYVFNYKEKRQKILSNLVVSFIFLLILFLIDHLFIKGLIIDYLQNVINFLNNL